MGGISQAGAFGQHPTQVGFLQLIQGAFPARLDRGTVIRDFGLLQVQRQGGWSPQETFESGLAATVEWYLDNAAWSSRILSGAYRTERLGLKEAP